jgi:hypothetical protein
MFEGSGGLKSVRAKRKGPERAAMHLQSLTPFVVSISLSVVSAVCAAGHHKETDSEDTFAFPPFVGYLMLFCGIIMCLAPLLPGAAGDIPRVQFFFMFCPFWGGAFLASIYFFRYRVVITDTTLTLGSLRRRQLIFDDVIDWDVIKGGRSSELVIHLRDGEKLRLSGLLSDFDELVGMVNSHMAIPPRGQPDSLAKLRDRAARVRDERIANWMAFVGIGLLAVAVYVASRLQ